jgi:hypothetical protein
MIARLEGQSPNIGLRKDGRDRAEHGKADIGHAARDAVIHVGIVADHAAGEDLDLDRAVRSLVHIIGPALRPLREERVIGRRRISEFHRHRIGQGRGGEQACGQNSDVHDLHDDSPIA